ncbi:hypothetical protein [Microbispora rosea]|uniref:hypothetical protein n=1 Tax=Microbispora rosea TaxID=58117 RepID=UPI00343E7633
MLTGEGLPPARRCLVCDRKELPFVHDPHCPEPDCDLPSGASCDGSHESTVHDMRQRALGNPATPPAAVLARLAGTVRVGSTLLPRIATARPPEVEELAASPNPAVRMLVAERRDLPSGIRDALAADPDAKVLKSIAPHPGLSEARLRAMVDRHGARVLARVARNPDASAALLENLVRHRPPVQKAFREVARHQRDGPGAVGVLAGRAGQAGRRGTPGPAARGHRRVARGRRVAGGGGGRRQPVTAARGDAGAGVLARPGGLIRPLCNGVPS